jgi:hypothetical protein
MNPWHLATSEWEWLDDTDDDLVLVEWVPQIKRSDCKKEKNNAAKAPHYREALCHRKGSAFQDN